MNVHDLAIAALVLAALTALAVVLSVVHDAVVRWTRARRALDRLVWSGYGLRRRWLESDASLRNRCRLSVVVEMARGVLSDDLLAIYTDREIGWLRPVHLTEAEWRAHVRERRATIAMTGKGTATP